LGKDCQDEGPAAVEPKNNIILSRRISALEVIKEEVSRFDIDVANVGTVPEKK
jgi:hypothetical protein